MELYMIIKDVGVISILRTIDFAQLWWWNTAVQIIKEIMQVDHDTS